MMENSESVIPKPKEMPGESLPQADLPRVVFVSDPLRGFEKELTEASIRYCALGFIPITQSYALLSDQIKMRLEQWYKYLIEHAPGEYQKEAQVVAQSIEVMLQNYIEKNSEVLSDGLDEAIREWEVAISDSVNKLPETVILKVDSSDLKDSDQDDKPLRLAKRRLRFLNKFRKHSHIKVPLRDLVENIYDVSGKPGMHKAMGDFTLAYFQILNNWRSLFARELKLLVLSIQNIPPDELKDLLIEKRDSFTIRIRELQNENEQTSRNAEASLRNVISEVIESAGILSVRIDVKSELKRRRNKLNKPALTNLNQRLKDFSKIWNFNQQSFHNQLVADLMLDNVSVSVFQFSNRIVKQVEQDYFQPVFQNAARLMKGIAALTEHIGQNKEETPIALQLNDEIFLSHRSLVNRLEIATDDFANQLPAEWELLQDNLKLTAVAFTRKVPKLKIALGRTADYLIKTNFTELHRAVLIESITGLNKINSKILNSANLINYALEVASEERKYKGVKDLLVKVEEDAAAVDKQLKALNEAFIQQLRGACNNTLSALDIRSVASRADQLKQYVSAEQQKSPLSIWLSRKLYRLDLLRKKLTRFVVRRRHEAVIAQFEKENQVLQNEGEQIYSFIEKLRISPEMDQKLPYYYKQLFSGKHLSNKAGIRIRKNEIAAAKKAVIRLRDGAGGAIAVVGDALTGKTFLSEHIAGQLIAGKTYRVVAPPGGSHRADDLYAALLSVCGKPNENIRSVFASIEPGSVFVFNDLEQWWIKQPNGSEAIAALCVLIEKFSRRHYFIFTSNSYSFRLMVQSTPIQNYLLSTILIRPVSQEEMREIIWLRHETGGLILESMGKRVEQLSGRSWDKLMSKFYRRSEGNVGLALRFWLCGIKQINGDAIRIEDPGVWRFPEIRNHSWKVIIYQLFLHRALSAERLQIIFEDEGADWLRKNIRALKMIGIVEETGRDVYALNDLSRPYIEKWFTRLRLIT